MRIVVSSMLCLTLAGVPALAQTPAANPEPEVRAAVAKMFEAMKTRDTAALRSVVDPGARLVTTGNRDGAPFTQTTAISDFIGMVATAAPGQVLDERLENTEVRISDNLATVWTGYKFYIGERFSHCGYDAFQLAKTAEGWKIIAIADTRRPAAQCQ